MATLTTSSAASSSLYDLAFKILNLEKKPNKILYSETLD